MHFTCSELCDVSQNKQCFSKLSAVSSEATKVVVGCAKARLNEIFMCSNIYTQSLKC